MTPLYDIMSAHPLVANKQLQSKKIKMAMALIGKNRHYHWYSMQPRHFVSTAESIGFNRETARGLFNEMVDKIDTVVSQVETQLPEQFPVSIASATFDGILKQRGNYV